MAASKKEKPIIEVKHLSKQYNIGVDKTYKTFCDSFTSAVRHPLKTLKGRSRSNDTFWALKDVNFEIECGDVVGIIGRNGAGKSTLLKVLSRITHPTEGEVKMHGRVGSLLEVGTGFHPELTGRENIYFNGAILGMKKREIDDKFDDIVKFSETEKFLDTPIKRYSSGMQVRLAFSVAAHLEPEILLIDEVLAVGDAAFQKKCLGKMKNISGEGRTILFVSHNMSAIQNICDRGILLQKNIIFDGEVDKAIDQYLNNIGISNRDVKLSERNDRIGNLIARYTDIKILNSCGQITNHIKMGESFTVEIQFETHERIQRPVYGIFFKDFSGSTILRSYSHESTRYFPITGNLGRIMCKFYDFPLMHGEYSISLWLGRPSECIDYIEDTFTLTIEPDDIYKTGILPDKNNGGVCFSKHSWKIQYE